MKAPILATNMTDHETAGGVSYKINGELVPVLQIELTERRVYFEHHTLLWKSTGVSVDCMPLKGAFKRMVAGMPVVMTITKGQGSIAFSRDSAGHVLAKHLKPAQQLEVREHQMLAATENLKYDFKRVKGAKNVLLGNTGLFIDTFTADNSEGVLWLHGHGNVFEIQLEKGESFDVEPGGWIYKDPTVNMETMSQYLKTGLLAGTYLYWNRFTGPGVVGIQSMYYEPGAEAE